MKLRPGPRAGLHVAMDMTTRQRLDALCAEAGLRPSVVIRILIGSEYHNLRRRQRRANVGDTRPSDWTQATSQIEDD